MMARVIDLTVAAHSYIHRISVLGFDGRGGVRGDAFNVVTVQTPSTAPCPAREEGAVNQRFVPPPPEGARGVNGYPLSSNQVV